MQQLRVPAHRVDPEFKHKLRDSRNGDTLKYCYQCGTCSAACPISRFIGTYRPNKILELAKLGIRNTPHSSAFLFCSACTVCTKGCPQNVRVHEVMHGLKDLADAGSYLAEGFDEAIRSLGREMPFPVVYSWLCLNPPEKSGGAYDDAVKNALERAWQIPALAPKKIPTGEAAKSVAIIGSGPAGLTAAWELAKAGLAVIVFEYLQVLGGMLRTGIPSFRLPKGLVDAEIAKIRAMGVRMQTGTLVDQSMFEELTQRYAAVFIASGASVSRKLRIDGAEQQGVVTALNFLKKYNTTGSAEVGKNVVVIGGGNVATDAAGAAVRCGAESVKLFCLEDRSNMPAHQWEIEEAVADGVEINPSWGPVSIVGDGEKVTGVEFVFCKSVLDGDGKFNPVYDEKRTQTVEADTVITAIGQAPDLSFLSGDINTFGGVVRTDPYTMETNLPNVFAGGDAVMGTASLIEAIAAGKTAAGSILRYL